MHHETGVQLWQIIHYTHACTCIACCQQGHVVVPHSIFHDRIVRWSFSIRQFNAHSMLGPLMMVLRSLIWCHGPSVPCMLPSFLNNLLNSGRENFLSVKVVNGLEGLEVIPGGPFLMLKLVPGNIFLMLTSQGDHYLRGGGGGYKCTGTSYILNACINNN